MSAPTLAVVGCGAIAELFHLPALARHPDVVGRLLLVDPNRSRASAMAERFGAASTHASLDEVVGRVDAVIILTPHRLHHRMVLEALRAGVHVLCEKPLAERAAEVDEIVAAATAATRHVAVNNTRRIVPAFRQAHALVADGAIGEIRRVEMTLGEPFDWPSAGDGYFGAKAGGRGVLADLGAHLLDLAAWWLHGPLELLAYQDDAAGGTEAVADVRFRRGAAEGHVRLSWLSKLPNRYRIEGTTGRIEGAMHELNSLTLVRGGHSERRKVPGPAVFAQLGHELIDNFLEVAAGRAVPIVSAQDVRASIALMDECYATRTRFPEPWYDAFARLAHV